MRVPLEEEKEIGALLDTPPSRGNMQPLFRGQSEKPFKVLTQPIPFAKGEKARKAGRVGGSGGPICPRLEQGQGCSIRGGELRYMMPVSIRLLGERVRVMGFQGPTPLGLAHLKGQGVTVGGALGAFPVVNFTAKNEMKKLHYFYSSLSIFKPNI